MGSFRLHRALLAGSAFFALGTPALSAPACDPFLKDAPAFFEQTIDIAGGQRVQRTVRLPPQSTFVLLAREGDVDVMLEVLSAGKLVGRADGAIRRKGIQRVVFDSAQGADYVIAITGKERATVGSAADLRVIAYPRASNDFCLGVQRQLALADQAYAAGHWLDQKSEPSPVSDTASPNALAVRYYAAAEALLAKSGASTLLAQAQHAQALLYNYDLRDWDRAAGQARAAAATYSQLGDLFERTRAQTVEAEADLEVASAPPSTTPSSGALPKRPTFKSARDALTSIATFHAGRGERYQQAWALNNVGVSYYLEGRHTEAIPVFQRTLAVFEQAKEQSGQALALQNLGMVEYELGRLSEASTHYTRVLKLIQQEDDPGLFAIILNNTALAHWAGGELDLALREFNQALRILRVTQDPFVLSAALHNTGCVYDALGDRARALEFYQQALALRTPQKDPRGRTASLRTIGNALREQGKAQDALKLHEEALSLAAAGPMKLRIQIQIAKDLGALGRMDEASQRLALVLQDAAPGDELTKGRALAERGAQRAKLGQAVAAEADLRAAQGIFQKGDAPEDEFDAWVALARLKRTRGAGDEALKALDRALALAEEVRMQSSNPELRATLLQPLRPAFDLMIELQAERYFAAGASPASRERAALSALVTAEQARARALADFQSFDVSAPGLPPELIAQRKDVYRQLAARRFRLASYLERASKDDARVKIIRADIASLRQRLDEIDARIGAASAANAKRPGPAGPGSLDFRALPQGVALVEYWLGAERAYAWSATREGLVMTSLGSSAAITEKARSLHAALRAYGAVPEARRLALAEELYSVVLAPLGPRVSSQRELVFALDGALHYVPFATLRVAAGRTPEFLIEHHEISVTPSLGMFLRVEPVRKQVAAATRMLLVADPVYELSDSRLARLAGGSAPRAESVSWPMTLFRGGDEARPLSRLPATANEAATIASLLPREGVDRLEGFTATRDRFLGAGLDRYRFIHIASHAVNDAEIPQASALILSTVDQQSQPADGRVLAADFVNVHLNAETVVLSACDTALGKSVAGEGLIGLQYVVLARGAGSVVSSLWPVADQATAQLMSQFYSSHLRGNAPLGQALGDAMRSMLAGRFKDPGVWGAFTLTVAHATSR